MKEENPFVLGIGISLANIIGLIMVALAVLIGYLTKSIVIGILSFFLITLLSYILVCFDEFKGLNFYQITKRLSELDMILVIGPLVIFFLLLKLVITLYGGHKK